TVRAFEVTIVLIMGIVARPEAVSKKSPSIVSVRVFKLIDRSVIDPLWAGDTFDTMNRHNKQTMTLFVRIFISLHESASEEGRFTPAVSGRVSLDKSGGKPPFL